MGLLFFRIIVSLLWCFNFMQSFSAIPDALVARRMAEYEQAQAAVAVI